MTTRQWFRVMRAVDWYDGIHRSVDREIWFRGDPARRQPALHGPFRFQRHHELVDFVSAVAKYGEPESAVLTTRLIHEQCDEAMARLFGWGGERFQ